METCQTTNGLTTTARKATAGIKRSLAIKQLNDLIEWKCRDRNRFTRMIIFENNKEVQICFSETFLMNIARICVRPDVLEFYPDLPDYVAAKLGEVGLELPEPISDEDSYWNIIKEFKLQKWVGVRDEKPTEDDYVEAEYIEPGVGQDDGGDYDDYSVETEDF